MKGNVFVTFTPLSLFNTVFGFYADNTTQKRHDLTTTAYCGLLTVLSLTIYYDIIVTRFCNLVYNFVVSFVYVLLDIVLITMLTLYRLKYVACREAASDILQNIDYADKCLTRIGVKIPHKKNLLLCALYAAVMFVINVINTLCVLQVFNSKEWFGAVNEPRSLCIVVSKLISLYSGTFLFAKVTFLLYLVKQRMSLIRCALLRDKHLRERRNAWKVPGFCQPSFRGLKSLRKKNVYYKNLHTIFNCIYSSFEGANEFYVDFFLCHVFLFIFTIALDVYIFVLYRRCWYILLFHLFTVLHSLSPMFLCMSITYDFNVTRGLLNCFHWQNNINTLHNRCIGSIRESVHEWTFETVYFDCNYFHLDLKLIELIVDFETLLIFTIIPQLSRS